MSCSVFIYIFLKEIVNTSHIYLFSQGNLKPDEASKVLSVFEGRFSRLKEERDNLRKAKEALELSQPEHLSASDDRMQVGLEELQDLKVSYNISVMLYFFPGLFLILFSHFPSFIVVLGLGFLGGGSGMGLWGGGF